MIYKNQCCIFGFFYIRRPFDLQQYPLYLDQLAPQNHKL